MQLHCHNPHMYSLRLVKIPGLLNASNTFDNRFKTSWRSPTLSTSSGMINIGCHISFKWVTNFGCICRNNTLPEPIRGSEQSDMSLTITKIMRDNAFELRIPPFLDLHPMFNVDCLLPCFPPLLDTSNIAEQLTPTELNPDCME